MPLTAEHAAFGVLDATVEGLGCGVAWERVHKVRPRAELACRGCGHRMHAKTSLNGFRFFAHDARVADCPMNGESLEHRLLKILLAGCVRDAGWIAELEVAGGGWRADVLATSPDGSRRVAWEAQLAAATVDELAARTRTMTAGLDAVCWVTDKDVPWVSRVPSVRIAPTRDDGGPLGGGQAGEWPVAAAEQMRVVDGVARFEANWCPDRRRCQFGGRCAGHGRWDVPAGLSLQRFVASVCADRVRVHEAREYRSVVSRRHPGGRVLWTASRYVHLEHEQMVASSAVEEQLAWRARTSVSARQVHRDNINRHVQRQVQVEAAVEAWARARGEKVQFERADRKWGMGVLVTVGGKARAVVCPVSSRVDAGVRSRLGQLPVIVSDERERAKLAAVCGRRQRIVVMGPVSV